MNKRSDTLLRESIQGQFQRKASKQYLEIPDKENAVGEPKEAKQKEIKPKSTIPRATPAKRPSVVKDSAKKPDLDF